jgi:hypothetical protein
MKTLALRARVFIHCFLVFGYPGETLTLVVHILHIKLPWFVSQLPEQHLKQRGRGIAYSRIRCRGL